MRAYRLLVSWSLLSLLWVVTGCGSPFSPPTLVERLRVLGIRAGDAGGVADASVNLTDLTIDNSLTLTALVADSVVGRTLTPTWGVCLTAISDAASSIDCPGANSLSLASGSGQCIPQTPSVECTSQLTPSDLTAWLTPQNLSTYGIDPTVAQDVDIWIGFLVTADNDEVRAVKRLPVHLYPATSTPDESTFNHNPVLTGLNGVTDNIDFTLGQKINLNPVIDESSRETFIPAGETTPQTEEFVFSWFSTIGDFNQTHTISASATNNQNVNLVENTWSIPESLTPDQENDTYVWVVMRDGRFGTDWMVFQGHFSTP